MWEESNLVKKYVIIVGSFLCFLIAFIASGEFDESGSSEMSKKVEQIETDERIPSKKSIMEQNFNFSDETFKSLQDSEKIEKKEEGKTPETTIKVTDSFVQIETNSINKRISFPSIDIADAEDMSNYINEQIYHEIIPEDFWEYGHGREDTEVQYEIETVGERIVSIHFYGYQSYWGSYAEYNKGMNFNLRTGTLISLKDYYTLSDIKAIIMNARDKNEITISNLPADEEELQRQIDNFVCFFDSEEYIRCTDNFFIKDNCIYFITSPMKSMREAIYIEMSLDKFRKLYQ